MKVSLATKWMGGLLVGMSVALLGGSLVWHLLRARAAAVTVDGRVVPPGRSLAPWLALRREQLQERAVILDLGDHYDEVRLAELGMEPDLEATLLAVKATREAGEGRGKNTATDISYRWKADPARLREVLRKYAPAVHREPVNARLDLTRHERIQEQPGRDLHEEATLAALLRVNHDDGEVVSMVFRATEPAVSLRSLANVDVDKVLATRETTFSLRGTGYGRAMNIRTAAKHLEGYVLGPGQLLSFNEVVGLRTEANGFTHAPEIVDDEMQDGIGGGTCQVASTVFAAALFGGLEIVQRRSHRRPSAYLPLGLDATVVDGLVDLKLRNPYNVPLIVHVFLPTPTSVRAEFLGLEPPHKVSYLTSVSEKEDFLRRITQKPELPPGAIVPHQKGRQGMTVVSRVVFEEADGRTWERSYRSEYHPVPEVFWLGPGASETSLPEMPEGAVGVERRGEI